MSRLMKNFYYHSKKEETVNCVDPRHTVYQNDKRTKTAQAALK